MYPLGVVSVFLESAALWELLEQWPVLVPEHAGQLGRVPLHQLTVQAHVPAHHSSPVQYTVHQGGYSSQYRLTFLHTTVHQYSTQYTRGYTAHSTGSRSCTPQYISEELLVLNVLVIRAGCGANFPRQRITGWAVPPPYSYGKCTDTTVTPLLCIVGWRRGNICADHISGNSDKPPLLARWRKNYWRDAQLRFIEPWIREKRLKKILKFFIVRCNYRNIPEMNLNNCWYKL